MDSNRNFIVDLELLPGSLDLETFTHLRIEVGFHQGGTSYITFNEEPRGIFCIISPVEITKQIDSNGDEIPLVKHVIDGNIKHQGLYVRILETKRKSPKKLEVAANKILSMADNIKDLFVSGDYDEVVKIVSVFK